MYNKYSNGPNKNHVTTPANHSKDKSKPAKSDWDRADIINELKVLISAIKMKWT